MTWSAYEDALGRSLLLPEHPRVIVVDNASTDGTVDVLRRRFPDVQIVRLADNVGAAGRSAEGIVEALAGLRWVWRRRRVVPPSVEGALRRLDEGAVGTGHAARAGKAAGPAVAV